ncbi:glycosyltransferase family 47 protein [Ruficoccus sp. ZRK36]|uniref:glycosyltransferase family 47 protein n=1 Tax=Ruficoccus sp. ZRK36 TaxID=2866311 RepID=UPI001C73D1D2|nr:glycosyltransferase family 47 protein [Ruficoccus sp. ZRK36]QYY35228.1 glycosyltransferase family 47 protein [Ruficoccus sp. ZRK36]
MPSCVIFSPFLTSRVLQLSRAFSLEGYATRILTRIPGPDNNADDAVSRRLQEQFPDPPLEDLSTVRVESCDVLIVLWSQYLPIEEDEWTQATAWAQQSKRTVLLGLSIDRRYPQRCRFELKSIVSRRRLLKKASRALNEDIAPLLSPLSLLVKQRYFGPSIHQMFLADPSLRQLIYSPVAPPDQRDLIFNFVGTRENGPRVEITPRIEDWLTRQGHDIDMLKGEPGQPGFYWWAYPSGSKSLTSQQYIQLLDRSRFTLCLPGFAGTTERVCESILRGSVPVLEAIEVPFYRLPLRDGQNAIIVKRRSDWLSTVQRLLSMSPSEVAKCQQGVDELRQSLDWPQLCRRIVAHVLA